ncbi:indole-3-glycerol phosphate synthase TrpC [Candidatus Methanoprimaticola sp. MG2]|uniref:indole-3-glycerol phosphate synthase TrpC n=1 Tax=Candidatus Methanoprimaticola sp. MG2 TaxID=3228838 RepID=UPI0039C5EB4A
MSSILDSIVESTRMRVSFERTVRPFSDVKEGSMVRPRRTGFPFIRNLRSDGMSFICEVKRASPSKGMISEEFPYLDIAKGYERAGASAISVLTEPRFFKGRDAYLEDIADTVSVPVLRKDFIIDEYQIYRAKEIGASAVLLIAAILSDRQLRSYRELAESLGMDALVEAHTREEVERAVSSDAEIIGINNRDLSTFTVDLGNSLKLRDHIPDSVVAVSESGITSAEDVRMLRDAGFDAVLVGEALMRSSDPHATLESMRS